MFEEDVRSEQYESNTFKPRYPVFLNDPSLAGNAANGPSLPPPDSKTNGNSLYPSANITISPATPTPPSAVIPSPPRAVTPTPPRAVTPTPSAPPADNRPSPSVQQTQTNKAGPNKQPSVEFLGFSIPPDYEPTDNTAPADAGNIGWK